MQAAKLIESRSANWRQLELLCVQLESRGTARKLDAARRTEFASLYRSACADLSLADAYQLPAETIRYLHQLVGRAHNQLYRTDSLESSGLWKSIIEDTPRVIFNDNSVRLAAALFWLPFLASMFLASDYSPVPSFAEEVVGREQLANCEAMHADSFEDRGGSGSAEKSGFYIWHNTTIGFRCFIWGLLFGVGGMFETLSNAVQIGAMFGYMTTVPSNQYFFEFVTAHGPFELTAVVLAAGAGMKMGFALVSTGGLRRRDSLMESARKALPIMYASMALFVGAAFIEGFLSPTTLPYAIKAFVGMICTLLLLGYFVVLGFHQQFAAAAEPVPKAPTAPERTSPFDD